MSKTQRNHIFRCFIVAIEGVLMVVRTQRNMWIHLFFMSIAIMMGVVLQISRTEWSWVILSIFLVIILEMVNTAIEQIVDLVTQEYRLHAKHAKDVAAGAVLMAALFSLWVAYFVFFDKLSSIVMGGSV